MVVEAEQVVVLMIKMVDLVEEVQHKPLQILIFLELLVWEIDKLELQLLLQHKVIMVGKVETATASLVVVLVAVAAALAALELMEHLDLVVQEEMGQHLQFLEHQ